MNNKEKIFISAIVYVKNSSKTISNFFDILIKVLNDNFFKYEIIFVNDGSLDNSVEIIKNKAKNIQSGSISIINMSYNEGKELSMNSGLDFSIGDFIYEFDSTIIDYPIETIINAYKKVLEGYDIVNVSSNSKRKLTSKIFYEIFNRCSPYQCKIDTETFRIISRRTINRINSINKTIPYRKAVFASSGLKMTTLKYNTLSSKKKDFDEKTRKEKSNNATEALILFTNIGYKFTICMIFIFIILTLFAGSYTVYTFINKNPIQGWTTTMLFLSFGFLAIFLILAIIIKYLSIIINLVFKKSNYLIESIEKIN